MANGWTDTHCHVLDEKMSTSPDDALQTARDNGVSRFIVIGCDAETTEGAIALASRHDDVWATVGLHPHEAIHGVDSIAGYVDAPKVVAIGECGLDFYYDHSPRDVQREAFARQIDLAKRIGLTLVIHTREAWPETLDVLDAEGIPENTVIHCFTGGPNEARACLDRGAYLSFSGAVTFKNAQDIRDAALLCPLDRLLVETDAPYLAPVPHRGKPNHPALVATVGTAIADLRGISPQELAQSSTAAALLAFPRLAS